MKNLKFLLLTMSLLAMVSYPSFNIKAQSRLHGIVTDSGTGGPIGQVNISLDGQAMHTVSDSMGRFEIIMDDTKRPLCLYFSKVGYLDKLVEQPLVSHESITVQMDPTNVAIEEVLINTGYQRIGKERATGAYSHLDSSMLNYRVGMGVLERLSDQVPGLIFNNVGTKGINNNDILIRGQSTIESRTDPLIVIDNFPYDGDINSINPADVESMTVLRDAVASSIWGARAGNGVIVITTKQGSYNSRVKLSFSGTYSFGARPDLSYRHAIGNAEYIDIEKELFADGVYDNSIISDAKVPLSAVVELLLEKRDHPQRANELDKLIEGHKNYDLRDDLTRYAYRTSSLKQYALNLTGGGNNHRYYLSGGADKNLETLSGNSLDRYTFRFDNVLKVLRDRIEINPQINYSNSRASRFFLPASFSSLYPYARIVDENGNGAGLALDYSSRFIEEARNLGLYDWSYNLLDEIQRSDNNLRTNDLRFNLRTDVNILPGLALSLNYQHALKFGSGENLNDREGYYTRSLLNQYSSISSAGDISRPIPAGSILDYSGENGNSYNFRAQLSFTGNDRLPGLNAIAGYEISENRSRLQNRRSYGYDSDYGIVSPVDYKTSFVQFPNTNIRRQVPFSDKEAETVDRFVSFYANASYEWRNKYAVSSSLRWDRSNLFGVKTNQKGVPLYSVGGAWNIRNEFLSESSAFDALKLRLTYGSSGNVNRSLSAFTTARFSAFTASNGLNYAEIVNPPNPQLRWEQIAMGNIGVDFGVLDSRISGTIDYYRKKGKDIIGESPLPPQTGVAAFRGNTANTLGTGLDVTLTTVNIAKPIKWVTSMLYHFEKEKVTTYLKENTSSLSYVNGPGLPAVGFPLYAVYSYRSAGLNPDTGAPQGLLEGNPSINYADIFADSGFGDLVYHGSARPTHFGSVRNTFLYKGVTLSFTLNFKLGYYFRRESIDYDSFLRGGGGHVDYYDRWQATGDEQITHVPSVPLSTDANRHSFYRYSDVLVERGDHLRFQDIKLSYEFHRLIKKDWIRSATLFFFANNIGLMWAENRRGIDPDVLPLVNSFRSRAPITLSMGLHLNL